MIELVFVIVVLGILAAVAIPRLAVTRDDAIVVKGRSDVAAIRSGISNFRSRHLMEGNSTLYPTTLENDDSMLFTNVMEYGIAPRSGVAGHWSKSDNTHYVFYLGDGNVTFTYNSSNGHFDCDHTNHDCNQLTR